MKSTASNRRLRLLLTAIRNKTLIPNPDFQRRLVWTNKDKNNFLETVLTGYPFPEIYIAAGEVDPQTGEGTEWLVDGQQRLSTLYQYFEGSNKLTIEKRIEPYVNIGKEEQIKFLEYEVVVRDLGNMSLQEVKTIFQKINATSYSLNAMEVHNARFDGEFKRFAEEITQHTFFQKHAVFSTNEIRRMRDISFILIFIITIMSTYFNREDDLEDYLNQYNDEFEEKEELRKNINKVLNFVEECNFDARNRVWKKSDLLTLLVEIYRLLILRSSKLNTHEIGERLKRFYTLVDSYNDFGEDAIPVESLKMIIDYQKSASQATNDRGSRIRRGDIINKIIIGEDFIK